MNLLHGSSRTPTPLALGSLLYGTATSTLFAHGGGSAGGFPSGLLHPISGLDHVIAMIAVGLWGAQLGNPAIWVLPIAFPLMMAMGASLALMGYPLPGVEIGIALSAIVLGVMVLFEVKPPLAGSILIVAFFALFHGHAHGTELAPEESAILYSLGFVIATGLLHATGIGIGSVKSLRSGGLALRACGAVVLAVGLFFLSRGMGLL